MRILHLHRWSRWRPYTQPMLNFKSGRSWNEPWQERTCSRCGKLQQERV